MSNVARDALPFQPPLVQVREEPLPWLLRLWPFGSAVLLIALVTLAAFVPIDVVVTAEGRIVTDDPPVVMKPLGSAVLDRLLVRPGDAVEPGQLLARLDARDPATDAAVLAAERVAIEAQIARIEAELDNRPVAGEGEEFALQARIQSERAATEAAQRDQLVTALAQIDGGIDAALESVPALAEAVATAREIETMHETLLARQSGTRLAVNQARLLRLDAETSSRDNMAQLLSLRQERETAAARLAAFESDLRQSRLEELAGLRPRLAVIDRQLSQATDRARLYDLRAPQAGVVLSVAEGGPGSLMTIADPVVVIAPTGGAMHAEIGLLSRDVGLVHPGDPVRIKVDAFPWRRHGLIAGRLTDVAPSSSVPTGGGPARHAARVAFDRDTALPDGLMPGMTLTSDIATGHRTLLTYFLDPVLNGLSESLREPRS
ncbi:secretion protein HlyD [Rhodovulum viride]|uniref:Membrane fusion protein (MFP) family protein n=1 Tax=Rhodovulum viride TaxID=1231134 RepID=A0ABX9DF34_9RHOB|nr:HlyD family type I secretion periplasmic adaptor subunit [Rhodovulum viride]RAP40966.1 secretion protein HlyD [Rhodovulum viride]